MIASASDDRSANGRIVFVGGGFRTVTFLASAPEVLDASPMIIERSSTFGPGSLGGYDITSASVGQAFLKHVDLDRFEHLLDDPVFVAIHGATDPVPLQLLGRALEALGRAIRQQLPAGNVLTSTAVSHIEVAAAGEPCVVHCRNDAQYACEHVVIATGREERLMPDLAPWSDRVWLSGDVLRGANRQGLCETLRRLDGGLICILGASHSGLAAAEVLLAMTSELRTQLGAAFVPAPIVLVQRGPARLSYSTVAEAVRNQVPERELLFDPERHVCPETGIVFRDSGLRHGAKRLYEDIWRGEVEGVSIHRTDLCGPADALFDRAGLIVQATGYRGRFPRLVDPRGVDLVAVDAPLRATADGGLDHPGPAGERVSVLRVETTPPHLKDNAADGQGLYAALAKRLANVL